MIYTQPAPEFSSSRLQYCKPTWSSGSGIMILRNVSDNAASLCCIEGSERLVFAVACLVYLIGIEDVATNVALNITKRFVEGLP